MSVLQCLLEHTSNKKVEKEKLWKSSYKHWGKIHKAISVIFSQGYWWETTLMMYL